MRMHAIEIGRGEDNGGIVTLELEVYTEYCLVRILIGGVSGFLNAPALRVDFYLCPGV